jgi:hypothetical protein
MAEPSGAPHPGYMAHQTVFVNVLTCQTVVAFLYRKGMVPDDPGHIDLLVQVFISLAGVKPVLVGSSDFHWHF